jgi:hypothetical protein
VATSAATAAAVPVVGPAAPGVQRPLPRSAGVRRVHGLRARPAGGPLGAGRRGQRAVRGRRQPVAHGGAGGGGAGGRRLHAVARPQPAPPRHGAVADPQGPPLHRGRRDGLHRLVPLPLAGGRGLQERALRAAGLLRLRHGGHLLPRRVRHADRPPQPRQRGHRLGAAALRAQQPADAHLAPRLRGRREDDQELRHHPQRLGLDLRHRAPARSPARAPGLRRRGGYAARLPLARRLAPVGLAARPHRDVLGPGRGGAGRALRGLARTSPLPRRHAGRGQLAAGQDLAARGAAPARGGHTRAGAAGPRRGGKPAGPTRSGWRLRPRSRPRWAPRSWC